MDTDLLRQISELIGLPNKSESDYVTIKEKTKSISDINSKYLEDNILKILCQGYCRKVVKATNGNYQQFFDDIDFELRKELIDYCLTMGVNKSTKFGRYAAPLLFFVEDEHIFEYLCSIGFDPNERLNISGYEGRPYFSLHHDFNINSFLIAIKNGFNINQKTNDNEEILHLIFKRFTDFDTTTIEKISSIFGEKVNTKSTIGLSCLQQYVLSCDVSKFTIENLQRMVELGFNKKSQTESEIAISEYVIPKGSSARDILMLTARNFNFDKHLVSTAETILKNEDPKNPKKKWWQF